MWLFVKQQVHEVLFLGQITFLGAVLLIAALTNENIRKRITGGI